MDNYKRKGGDITLVNLSNYVRPQVEEHIGRKWVLNGKKNWFFQYIIDRYNGSPTNESVINVYNELLYGKGISINGQDDIYEDLSNIFSKRDQRKCLNDYKLFGQYAMQLLRAKGGGIAKIMHVPMDKIGMERVNDDGNIEAVYYCDDWTQPHKFKPKRIPLFDGKMSEALMIKVVKPYQAGKFYFSDPDYLAGLQYAEMEEEISNFCINHIKNGLSFGYVINMNNGGALTDEMKDKIEWQIKEKLTGSENAGRFIISFNDGKEAEVSVVPLEVNDAHNQWEFLTKESRQQILTAHGVTSPLLFGLPSAGGFGANADELDTASKLLQDYQISPKQEIFIDELASILELNNLETDLAFIPLRESYKSTEESEEEVIEDDVVDEEEVEMSSDVTYNIEAFLEEGEDEPDGYELLDVRDCHEMTLSEHSLNTIFEFARVPKDDNNIERSRSKQDTSLFKVRYKYAGNPTPEREFCRSVMFSGKIFKEETLNKEQFITPKMGKGGSNTYNPFLFKGGVNCKHWWQRVIYLKKDNNFISVNKARKLILELDPGDRDEARWEQNDPRVSQSASESNNYWKA